MKKWQNIGLSAFVAGTTMLSACGDDLKPVLKDKEAVNVALETLEENIDIYEGKFVKTRGEVIKFEHLLTAAGGKTSYYNVSMVLADEGSALSLYNHLDKSLVETGDLQKFESRLAVLKHEGTPVFVSGWIEDCQMEYVRMTDSKGKILYEVNPSGIYELRGKVVDMHIKKLSSERFLNLLTIDLHEGGRITAENITRHEEEYSSFTNSDVLVESRGESGFRLKHYNILDIGFDESAKKPLKEYTRWEEFFADKLPEQQVLQEKLDELDSMAQGSPDIKIALEYYDLAAQAKQVVEETDNPLISSLADDIIESMVEAYLDNEAYGLAIESYRTVVGDKEADELCNDILHDLKKENHSYRAAKLADSYNLPADSRTQYSVAFEDLVDRCLWKDALEVAEEAGISAGEVMEKIEDWHGYVQERMKVIHEGVSVEFPSSYLSQTGKNTPLVDLPGADEDAFAVVGSAAEEFGRFYIKGFKVVDKDTIPIEGEMPVTLMERKD